ncbi:MAG: 6-carboxytetrahydropterin synthase [Lachnospiraceae bacterium]|jgi:6-pyruvoyl tetrahydropterin synthase-like protein|nr:6-carboxytetrahydropterin synthase [Lachnospiraceae bacterium]
MENNTRSGAVYCFHYLLPMTHSTDNIKEHIHSHTLEITVYISGIDSEHESFSRSERYAGDVLKQYENRYFNEMPEFCGDTSVENVGEVFFKKLTGVLMSSGIELKRLEIGENPLRQYVISTYM